MSETPSLSGVLEIRLLGPFRAIVDGLQVPEPSWERRKSKALIKILALQSSHQLHREQLMDLLWPEMEREQAANNLNKTIHSARRTLEPSLQAGGTSRFVVTQDQQVLLRAPGGWTVDADEFERDASLALKTGDVKLAERALGLYVGDLLEEDRYEDWASVRRERLRTLRLELLLNHARLCEGSGEPERAIESLQTIVRQDACHEPAHRALMRLFATSGKRHLAVNQFRQCAESLKKELDAEPEASTVRLHEEILAGAVSPLATENDAAPPPKSVTAEAVDSGPFRSRGWVRMRWTFLFLFMAIVGAVLANMKWHERRMPPDSLAVLPFTSQPAGKDTDYLVDGITEGLINSLSRVPELRVMARSTVFRFKENTGDPVAAGRDLKVRAVLSGSVSKREGQYIIHVELVDVSDGSQVWGDQYNINEAELPAVEERIANGITSRLRLGQEQASSRHATSDGEAYRLYLLGRYHFNRRSREGFLKAIDYYRQAIERDPDYAMAYAGLADAYGLLGYESGSPKVHLPTARAMAVRALELDESLAEAHTSMGMIKALYDWDWAGAEKEFQRAIQLNSGYATAHHWYGVHLAGMGRFDQSRDSLQRAQNLDPLSTVIADNLAFPDHYRHKYDAAILQYKRAIELDPNFPWTHEDLMLAYEQKQMFPEAAGEAVRLLDASGEPELAASFRKEYARSGYPAALKLWAKTLEDRSKTDYVPPVTVAQLYARLGRADDAFRWLEKGFNDRSGPMVYLNVDPRWDKIRKDPRFESVLHRVGLI